VGFADCLQVMLDRPVLLGQRDKRVTVDRLDPRVNLDRRVTPVEVVPLASVEHRVSQDRRVRSVNLETPDCPEARVHLVQPA